MNDARPLLPPSVGLFGRGLFVPEDVLTNEDVAGRVDPARLGTFVAENAWCREEGRHRRGDDPPGSWPEDELRGVYAEFVRARLGIERRRVVDRAGIVGRRRPRTDVCVADLGAAAARAALADAGIEAGDVGVLVCATSSPRRAYPATAVEILQRLGTTRAHGFDVLAGCSGLVVGLEVACGLVLSGGVRRALLVTAEHFTAGVDYDDPATACFFGDGAAAFVVGRLDGAGSEPCFAVEAVRCLSSYSDAIRGSVLDETEATGWFTQDGPRAYRELLPMAVDTTNDLLADRGLSARDIARFVPHQASAPLLDGYRRRLLGTDAPDSRFASGLAERGNTSCAGAAMLLAEDRSLAPGERVCVCVFGAGYSVGAALLVAGG